MHNTSDRGPPAGYKLACVMTAARQCVRHAVGLALPAETSSSDLLALLCCAVLRCWSCFACRDLQFRSACPAVLSCAALCCALLRCAALLVLPCLQKLAKPQQGTWQLCRVFKSACAVMSSCCAALCCCIVLCHAVCCAMPCPIMSVHKC